MPDINRTLRLQRLVFFIRANKISSAEQAAVMLECSDRTIKYDITLLRKSGFDIHYERSLKKYVLREE